MPAFLLGINKRIGASFGNYIKYEKYTANFRNHKHKTPNVRLRMLNDKLTSLKQIVKDVL